MTYHARVNEAGEIVLPAELVQAFGIRGGDDIVIERDQDGGLRLKTYAQVVKETQLAFRAMLPPGSRGSLVDELLADRRAEAAQEDAEHQEWLQASKGA